MRYGIRAAAQEAEHTSESMASAHAVIGTALYPSPPRYNSALSLSSSESTRAMTSSH